MLELITGILFGAGVALYAGRLRRSWTSRPVQCTPPADSADLQDVITFNIENRWAFSTAPIGFFCRCGCLSACRWHDPNTLVLECPECGPREIFKLQGRRRCHSSAKASS